MLNLHSIDIFIIITYLIGCLIIGFISSRKIHNIKDYAVGGKYVNSALLIGTFIATDIGAGATVGLVEKVYTMGLIFAFGIMFRPFFWLIASWVFSNDIERFRSAGCITVSDIMEHLYGKTAKWITNIMAITISVGILALQITAMSYLFSYFLNISSKNCAMLAFGVLVTYSCFGGVRAVIITDLIQAIIFFIGIPVAFFIAYTKLHIGYEDILIQLPTTHISIDWSTSNIIIFLSLILNVSFISNGPFVQRYLMANNQAQLRKAITRCFFFSLPFTLIICCIGFLMKLSAPDINPNLVFYHLINTYLPVGLKGFLIAGILAVIMSTADSWLNTASVICAHDIIKSFFPNITNKLELILARVSLLCISAFSGFLAISNNESTYASGLVWSFWAPIIFIPLCAGFLGFKTDNKSFIGSCVGAIVCSFLANCYLSGEFFTLCMVSGVAGSAIGLFGTHYWRKHSFFNYAQKYKIRNKKPFYINAVNSLKAFILKRLLKPSEILVLEHGNHYFITALSGWVIFLLGMFLTRIDHSNIVVSLYGISVVFCVVLLIHECFFPLKLFNKYLPLHFHLTLLATFMLPACYMAGLSKFHMLWLVNLILCSLFVFILAGLRATIILLSIGVILSTALSLIFHETYSYEHAPSFFYFVILSLMMALVIAYKEFFQKGILNRMDNYTKMMAHQMLQPVTQTSLTANYVNDVLSHYQNSLIKDGKDEYYLIKKQDFLEVQHAIKDLEQASKSNQKMVNGILSIAKSDIENAKDLGIYDINRCLKEALLIYNASALDRISVNSSNSFKFKGSFLLVTEVLRNIISNSFKHAGGKARIEIRFKNNSIHIRDNGKGIAEEKLENLFLLDSPNTGLGLPFCKKVMDATGGKIECKSRTGKYTEFILGFPKVTLK